MEGLDKTWRIGALILILVVFGYYGYKLAQEPMAAPPCSTEGFPGRCYHVPEGVCDKAWAAAEIDCKEFIKGLNLGPGRLVGPAISICRLAKFDDQFPYSRRSSEECDQSHVEMEDWKRRNMK